MKRKEIAALVAGLAVGAAHAQSAVTVYGLIDAAYTRDSGLEGGGATSKISSGVFNGSRIGFRGTEDLGGGLSASFVLENGFQVDTGTMGQGGLLFGRQAFVGLDGKLGSLRFGRQYTPLDTLAGNADPFFAGSAGRMTNLFAERYVDGANGYFTNRVNNAITYTSPVLGGGYSAHVGYGFGENAANASAGRYVGASFGYAAGPLYLRVAHQNINNAKGDGAARNTGLGSYYDFGPFRLHAAYALNRTTAASARIVDSRDWMVGAVIPSSVGRLMLSYVKKRDNLAARQHASQVAVGGISPLSKRTDVYFAYGDISNENGASYKAGSATEGGSGSSALNIGIQHRF